MSAKRFEWSALALAVTLVGVLQPSHAMTEGACRDDAKTLCSDVKPGGGRIKDCLKSHAADLSQGCKDNIAEVKEDRKEVQEACMPDVKKLCSDVKPGEGRIRDCLKAHEDQVSSDCKQSMGKIKAMRHHRTHETPDNTDAPPTPDAK